MFRAAPAVELVELPAERCLRWSGTMARSEFHESYIELAARLAGRAAELGPHAGRQRVVVLRDPTDKGLAGGDETVLRYELCLPVSRRAPAAPAGTTSSSSRAAGSRAASSPASTRTATASPMRGSSSGSPTAAASCAAVLRMRFIRDERDTADPADFATELIWPVTRAACPQGARSGRRT